MIFVSTSTFRESIKLLTKRPENGYKSCHADICNELKGLSLADISNKHFLVKQIGHLRVIKLRIQNSDQTLSSAAGYRLIIVCNEKYDHVAFLQVYPKRGKYSKIDLTKNDYKDILNTYGFELKNETLIEHDINNNLKVIEGNKTTAKQ